MTPETASALSHLSALSVGMCFGFMIARILFMGRDDGDAT